METKKLDKLLVANRGEIAIRILRAASELGIGTLAVFTHEDRFSPHRFKADEAYQIGEESEPLKPYLDIEEIIATAKRHDVDAIHPGYGFLSENTKFARRCREEGLIFVGPEPECMEALGDKVSAKKVAIRANAPIIEDNRDPLTDIETVRREAERIGYPVLLKAAAGGGGRGMRAVKAPEALETAFNEARSEAKRAFDDDTIFIEKFIESPRHIEVQILADNYGNMVHLFERDCSVQRRFQKVVEVAPSASLKQQTKDKLYEYALNICREVRYNNAGTVEFLVDKDENVYFIEVNPRIQVEHTITEEVTGVDIVRSQILIAQGHRLSDPQIYLRSQEDVSLTGFAIQCRITSEDPESGFKPDYGTVIAYRHAAGFGIRLDEGPCYAGAKISPFFDSMLVKVSAWGRTLRGASERLHRALREFRVRGVKTNIGFLMNVIQHEAFIKGRTTVNFIDNHPELFEIAKRSDRATRLLRYVADVAVNGNPDVKAIDPNKNERFRVPKAPAFDKRRPFPDGTKNKLRSLGREGFIDWLKNEKAIQYTDTTFRDAHQSLLATRMRTVDMLNVAESYAKNHPETFSMEVWGGATFDVCLRFLKENPWERLRRVRASVPNILLQMLLRGANAVGYKAYPENVIERFIIEAAANGVDIFRIFDSLNDLDNLKFSIHTVRERTDALAEAAICYTGDVLKRDSKYTFEYYADLAKRLEDEGAHILAIKDMAGLLKPYSAVALIEKLREAVDLPIHLHTHDTAGIQTATYLKAIEAGVDVIDCAIGALSGLTSQPNFNSVAAMMQGQPRENRIDLNILNEFSNYWEDVREYYYPFESELKANTAEVYENEIPGGQYSNLRPQARGLGLEDKFDQIKKNYVVANRLLGDIVKVTPSSKVVGDMAMYLTANNLTEEDILERGHTLSFPESVVNMLRGNLGQPLGGFPERIREIVLKGEEPNGQAQELEPVDFVKDFKAFKNRFDEDCTVLDFLSYLLYPKVYEEYYEFHQQFGEMFHIPTKIFFYGMKEREQITFTLAEGKVLLIKLSFIGEPDENGMNVVSFDLNGQNRRISVRDRSYKVDKAANRKADRAKPGDIGAPLQGRLASLLVEPGQAVKENAPLFVVEAMKMETTITAPGKGKVRNIILTPGQMVEQDDLVMEMEVK